ncbi:MAG: twin-arginine translocase subunit TatB [Acidobacteria bacterium]|nr:twin-arginine translocase subunit TatB [Acidobacteriota bacterium]
MGTIGFQELLFIFVIALLVFGPRRLPELGRSVGKGLAEFKRATSGLKDSIEREIQSAEIEASITSTPKSAEAGNNLDAPKT